MKQIMKRWIKIHWKLFSMLAILLCITVLYFSFFSKMTVNESHKETYVTNVKIERSDIQLFGDKKQYVLAPNHVKVSKKYAITYEKKEALVENPNHLQLEDEYYNLILYNLEEEGLPERKIDLYKVVRNYQSKSIPIFNNFGGSVYLGDVHYFSLEICDLSDEKDLVFKNVYLNLVTEEVVDFPKDTKFERDSDISDTAQVTNYNKILRSLGYFDPSNEIGVTRSEGQEPDLNINLYSLYPDLEDKLINQDWSLYIRPDKVTPDEWFDTLLHWFAPKGEDILTVYGRNDDGKASDVQIHNSQEANAWLEQHPALKTLYIYKVDKGDS